MKNYLDHNFPAGYTYKTELMAVFFVLAVGSFTSAYRFLAAYKTARQALYISRGVDLILDESRDMTDFVHLLGDKLLILLLLSVLVCIVAMTIHYGYHQIGSRSIYLMCRLPNRFELHRRCLLFPLVYAVTFVLVSVLLFFIFYTVYMNTTPEACLTPNQWQKIWTQWPQWM